MNRPRPSIPFLFDLLRLAMRREASAVYVVPWMPPTVRLDERSVPLSSVSFTPEQAAALVLDVLDDVQRAALDRSREVQFSLELPELGRFRVHAFRRHGQPAMSIRPYVLTVPTLQRLALPPPAGDAALAGRGLLVVASASASLRRDAAAALLEHRNRQGRGEIALLDEASRYWFEGGRCELRQGLTSAALKLRLQQHGNRRGGHGGHGVDHALAIGWGELRDGARLAQAVQAADAALCLLTLDADGPLPALRRLAAVTDAQGEGLRRRTALALHRLLWLRPVPAAVDGRELAATVVLANSPDLAAAFADDDGPALKALLDADAGSFDEHLGQLVTQGLVEAEVAARHAIDREAFDRRRSAEPPRGRPEAPAAPMAVDSAFAGVFDDAAPAADAFDFAATGAPPPPAADTQFDGTLWVDAEPRPLAPPTPAADSVQFHAWAPARVAPGALVAIDLWAAQPAQAEAVATQARRVGARPPAAAVVAENAPRVQVQLRIDGLLDGALLQWLAWTGRPERVRFTVPVPTRAQPRAHVARLRLSVGALPIGELSFVLHVSPDAMPAAPLEDAQAARRMLQSAYAAYAPSDAERVRRSVDEMHRVAPSLEVFLDAPALRQGEQWRERIERESGRRERMFLFWSTAAAESPWVDFEWRLALRRRGPAVIDAVLLEPPRLVPLPPELADVASIELRLRAR